jgi:phosphoribosylamine--glycine ligase
VLTPALHARAMREVIQPVIAGMEAMGERYTGFLYAGLMVTPEQQLKVLEFNCRLGDPETQPILMRLKSDLFTLIEHASNGQLDRCAVQWDRRVALGVVLAAAGYPDEPRKGDAISGVPRNEDDFHVFHAATALSDGSVITNGGRVLCVTALGDTVRVAQRRAYEIAERIQFAGKQMRRDIGQRAIEARRSPL